MDDDQQANCDNRIAEFMEILSTYILTDHPSEYERETLPQEESLVELGVLDSYGVIELVEFIETQWNCHIEDEELTKEQMGSIRKMAVLIASKVG